MNFKIKNEEATTIGNATIHVLGRRLQCLRQHPPALPPLRRPAFLRLALNVVGAIGVSVVIVVIVAASSFFVQGSMATRAPWLHGFSFQIKREKEAGVCRQV